MLLGIFNICCWLCILPILSPRFGLHFLKHWWISTVLWSCGLKLPEPSGYGQNVNKVLPGGALDSGALWLKRSPWQTLLIIAFESFSIRVHHCHIWQLSPSRDGSVLVGNNVCYLQRKTENILYYSVSYVILLLFIHMAQSVLMLIIAPQINKIKWTD